jgi:ATP-dependent 26S proteasome regulatory subunit
VLISLASAASASKCASCAKCVPIHFRQSCAPDTALPQIIELPLLNPELFQRVSIKPPKGVLLYGPPGTVKTLLPRAEAATLETNFLKVVSAIVGRYISESARVVRKMFGYARDHEPCVIFIDKIDSIVGCSFPRVLARIVRPSAY